MLTISNTLQKREPYAPESWSEDHVCVRWGCLVILLALPAGVIDHDATTRWHHSRLEAPSLSGWQLVASVRRLMQHTHMRVEVGLRWPRSLAEAEAGALVLASLLR